MNLGFLKHFLLNLQDRRRDSRSTRAKKVLDALENDTKANFQGKPPWQSTISEKITWGGGHGHLTPILSRAPDLWLLGKKLCRQH